MTKLKANISGSIVSVEVTVDQNTAILIRALRKSDTPITNGAKPADIPAAGEKLTLTSESVNGDKESFAKKLVANIENPESMKEYADKVAHKAEKASHKTNKKEGAHFDRNSVKGAGPKAHSSTVVAPVARKSPGAKGA
jgi:hypothetical protein